MVPVPEGSCEYFRDTGDRHGEGQALNSLGLALREARRFEEAITALQSAARLFRETGDPGDQHSESIVLDQLQETRQ